MRTVRKSKRERFQTVARKRTERLLGTMKRLERCANRAHYDYTDEEAERILTVIEARVWRLKLAFEPEPKLDF